jgi:hypothetical protein
VQEDAAKPPLHDDNGKGPAHIEVQDVAFAYESRPHAKVLEGIDVEVSSSASEAQASHMLTFCRPVLDNSLL